MLELDFDSNPRDIINSEHHEFDNSNLRIVKEYTPEYRRSLRVCFSLPLTVCVYVCLFLFGL